jgi:hypothetical protein
MKNQTGRSEADLLPGLLRKRVSRSQLLSAAGLGVVAAAIPGVSSSAGPPSISYPFYPQVAGSYSPENISDISRTLHTSEHLAAGVMFTALQSSSLNLKGGPLVLSIVQAALVQHQRHAEFLDSIGNPNGLKSSSWFVSTSGVSPGVGAPSNPVILTMPAGILDSQTAFFTAMEWLETLYVGMYTAAIREFAEIGQPEVAKWMGQILGVEGGLRVLARTAQDITSPSSSVPPNNKAFETDYLLYVQDAVPALIAKGFFNGSGARLPIFSPTTSRQSTFLDVAGTAASTVLQQTPNDATSTDVMGLPSQRL